MSNKIDLVYKYFEKREDVDNQKFSRLILSIKTAVQFLQCVDKIFIVTDKHLVQHFEDIINEQVLIIDYLTLIPSMYLPTFNSETIQSYLHYIPNLSEYFLFNRKHFLFTAPICYSDLITTSNKFNMSNSPMVDTSQSEQSRYQKRLNYTVNLLKKLMYIIEDKNFINNNNLIILRKNTLRTIEIIFSEELNKMRLSKITTATMVQYMFLATNFDHLLKKNIIL